MERLYVSICLPASPLLKSLSGLITSFRPRKSPRHRWCFSRWYVLSMPRISSDLNTYISSPSWLWNPPSSLCAKQGLWASSQSSWQIWWMVLNMNSYTLESLPFDVDSTCFQVKPRLCSSAAQNPKMDGNWNFSCYLLLYKTWNASPSLYFYMWLAEVRDTAETL